MTKTNEYISSAINNRIMRRRIITVIPVFCVIVFIAVFWSLKLNGVAMAGEAFCGIDEHSHTEDCIIDDSYVCGFEEHIHDTSCYSNINADLETSLDWEQSFENTSLTGIYSIDIVTIAETQIGYEESSLNYILDNEGNKTGYNRYGQWYGNPYGKWSALFVDFCLSYANIDNSVVPYNSGTESFRIQWEEAGLYTSSMEYVPSAGDLVFIDNDANGTCDSIGIITDNDSDLIAIFGDLNNAVTQTVVAFDSSILGYGILPAQQEEIDEEIAEETDCTLENNISENDSIEEITIDENEEEITESSSSSLSNKPTSIVNSNVSSTQGATVGSGKNSETIIQPIAKAVNFSTNYEKDAFINNSAYAAYFNTESPLGAAGSFHIVAFDTAYLQAHTNGNVLAKNLSANSNFGTNNYTNELSYVQNYKDINGNSASRNNHILVIGSSNSTSYVDNGNAIAINNRKIDNPKNIIKDNNTATAPFIDLVRVKNEMLEYSNKLASLENSGLVYSKQQDAQNSFLTLQDPDGIGVINYTVTSENDLSNLLTNYVKFDGFTSGKLGTSVINVDCSKVSKIRLPEKARMVVNGNEVPTSEVTEFSAGKIIWNLINAEGVTVDAYHMTGTILAPGATVYLNQNINGTIIADTIYVRAESHRTDFTGIDPLIMAQKTTKLTINKVWLDHEGKTLSNPPVNSINVTVYQVTDGNMNNKTVYSEIVLTKDKNWTATLNDLPMTGKNNKGILVNYTYTVKEISNIDGFVTSYDDTTPDTVIIKNKQGGIQLPETGGMGAYMYVIFGCSIMLVSAIGIITIKCRSKVRKSDIM